MNATEGIPIALPTDIDLDAAFDLLLSLLPFAEQIGFVGEELQAQTEGLLVRDEQVSSWPGTSSLAGTERMRRLQFTAGAVRLLKDAARSVAWQGVLPSDIFLLRKDGTEALVTISSHDRTWLQLTADELGRWAQTASPELVRMVLEAPEPAGLVVPLRGLVGEQLDELLRRDILEPLVGSLSPDLVENVSNYLASGTRVLGSNEETVDVIGEAFTVTDGADLLTDGRFCWRRDAASYVELYRIAPQPQALDYFRSLGWSPPSLSEAQLEAVDHYIWTDF